MTSRSISLPKRKSFTSGLSPETIHVILLMLAAIVMISPTVFWGMPSSRDLSNHFRFALPFYDALRSGHLYPGWLAESNGGFGDASFRFYPPALYYLLALLRAITGDWYAASVSTFAVLSALGALGVYFWAREFGSSETAMWAGMFYSVAPYHLNQLFQALMLAEFAGAAVLPFAFAFTERVCRHRRGRDVAGLAIAYALLVLTHLPLAVIGSMALFVYALLRTDRKKLWATISALSFSVALGLAASACYWTTMLLEVKWIRADNVNPEPGLDYRDNFVLSTFSTNYLNVWWMNILLFASLAMFWPALVLWRRSARERLQVDQKKNSISNGTTALGLLLLQTLFMATPLSRPIWTAIRPLQETQFPWRWLSISSMVCAMLLSLSIPFWRRLAIRKRPLVMFAFGTFAIAFAFSLSHIVREAHWLSPAEFQQTLNSIPGSQGVYQWLPIWTKDQLPSMSSTVEAGDRKITIEQWEPERRVFRVDAGQSSAARVRTFFYPHWKATANGRDLDVYPDQQGAIVLALPPNAETVTLEFREPERVRFATVATLIGWMIIGGLFLASKFSNSQAKQLECVK